MIFVVDSNDHPERMEQAREEFHRLADEEDLQDVPFLVLFEVP